MQRRTERQAAKLGRRRVIMAAICLWLGWSEALWPAEAVTVPGDVNAICLYSDFFYNLPQNDFIYYLNDRLLYTEPPNDQLYPDGWRSLLLRLTTRHRDIRDFLETHNRTDPMRITLNLNTTYGWERGSELLGLLGILLRRQANQQLLLVEDTSERAVRYFSFSRMDLANWQKQLNKNGILYFELKESAVSQPWELRFLREITGLDLNEKNFWETLLQNKRFSLLLGLLFRLSEEEIDFIGRSIPQQKNKAWQKIYGNKKMLLGLFVLSSALRVRQGELLVPGGREAELFWSTGAAIDLRKSPFAFLESLATRDDGKLNYLYVFSFFLPPETRRLMLGGFDPAAMRDIYPRIELAGNEKLTTDRFPRLGEQTYFTLGYAMNVNGGVMHLPGGNPAWDEALTDAPPPVASADVSGSATALEFVRSLLKGGSGNADRPGKLQRFITLVSKFQNRDALLTADSLRLLAENLDKCSVLVDYIEKIPLQKTETVRQMFAWLKRLEKLDRDDRALTAAVFQSLFEILAHSARHSPRLRDFDQLVSDILQFPLQRAALLDAVLDFLNVQLNLQKRAVAPDQALFDWLSDGLTDLRIVQGDEPYQYALTEQFQSTLREILESQEVCPLSVLFQIQGVLQKAVRDRQFAGTFFGEELTDAFHALPFPDMSKSAPTSILRRVVPYSRGDLESELSDFIRKAATRTDGDILGPLANRLKGNYLIYHLKDYLVAFAYALNAKSAKLRIFLNPNMIRLHDFEEFGSVTPWNYGGVPLGKENFPGFYLKGGLSRLNLSLAAIWKDHLFGKKIIYDNEQAQAVLYNVLDFYPQPPLHYSHSHVALLIDLAVELLQQAKSSPELKSFLMQEAGEVTAGYHYRKIMDYLMNRENDFYLFFSELFALGNRLAAQERFLDGFSARDEWEPLTKEPLRSQIAAELAHFGGIYPHTFGNLHPWKTALFPQEVANLFGTGWTAGEINAELKIKAAYHAFKCGVPAALLGQVMLSFLDDVCRKFYSQNYVKDYFSTYFIFDVFNNSHIKNFLKKSQQEGALKLQ